MRSVNVGSEFARLNKSKEIDIVSEENPVLLGKRRPRMFVKPNISIKMIRAKFLLIFSIEEVEARPESDISSTISRPLLKPVYRSLAYICDKNELPLASSNIRKGNLIGSTKFQTNILFDIFFHFKYCATLLMCTLLTTCCT